MSKTSIQLKNRIRTEIENAIKKAMDASLLPKSDDFSFIIEEPADRKNGDLSTNAAMANARIFRMAPQKSAQIIIDNLDISDDMIDRCEIAGPGFINFYFSKHFYTSVLRDIENEKEHYGESTFGQNKKIMVEFVSANPTGPMHIGNARGGALGDCLSSVLDKAGYEVFREFYVNDAGNQIEKFAKSLEARYLQIYDDKVEFPEDGYQGSDITEHAENYAAEYGDFLVNKDSTKRKKVLVDYALPKNIDKMQSDMKRYRINFDNWFFESTLYESNDIKRIVKLLSDKGLTYEKEGALWYKNKDVITNILLREGKTQEYIDKLELKDDVLIRTNGNPTYFASDIAYHKNKFDRGFDKLIDIWGADHHGHVMRMKGAMESIGYSADDLDIVLMQLVKLIRDGKEEKMSKRTGKAIQLSDLLDEIPVDSARFIFNTKEANTQMDFDLDMALSQDNENPVYYVQYAHARICSILRNLEHDNITMRQCSDDELLLLSAAEEIELINHLSAFDETIIQAAKEYDPTKITHYVTDLATLFHKFYNARRVKGDDESLMQARITLICAVKTVIKNVLDMFNITCPDRM